MLLSQVWHILGLSEITETGLHIRQDRLISETLHQCCHTQFEFLCGSIPYQLQTIWLHDSPFTTKRDDSETGTTLKNDPFFSTQNLVKKIYLRYTWIYKPRGCWEKDLMERSSIRRTWMIHSGRWQKWFFEAIVIIIGSNLVTIKITIRDLWHETKKAVPKSLMPTYTTKNQQHNALAGPYHHIY